MTQLEAFEMIRESTLGYPKHADLLAWLQRQVDERAAALAEVSRLNRKIDRIAVSVESAIRQP